MIAIISFFLGLGLIILKNDIFNQWIVSIIGIILMGYGVKYYIDLKTKILEKEEEKIDVLKKMESNMLTVSNFEKIVSQLEKFESIQESQKENSENLNKSIEKFIEVYIDNSKKSVETLEILNKKIEEIKEGIYTFENHISSNFYDQGEKITSLNKTSEKIGSVLEEIKETLTIINKSQESSTKI